MKINLIKIILSLLICIVSNGVVFADEFCNGFERGYTAGHKQATGSSIDPITPICPIEPIKKFSDPDSDFEFGYTIGYQQGSRAG